MRVAVVGFGGAGQDQRPQELRATVQGLISTIFPYDCVVLVAGLGGRGGEYLVKAARLLRNVAAIFVVWPHRVERIRIAKAEGQLFRLRGPVFMRRLDDYFEEVPEDKSLAEVLRAFDEEIAREVAMILRELRQ